MGPRCGVLGDPIAHSLSPVLHRAGYAACGLDDWSYDAHRVDESSLPEFLAGLDHSWRGLSLTMPLKRAVLPLADEVSDRVRVAHAANTLVFRDGRASAHNTDIPGAIAALREQYAGAVSRATILGGGATATSLGMALVELGATHIDVLVRSADRAAETLEVLSSLPSSPQVEVGDLATAAVTGDVVASTIPAGAQTVDLVRRCGDVPVVFEALYDPWPTPLASAAADRPLVGGLDLLVHQAALQFEMFTGQSVAVEVMRTAGLAALQQSDQIGLPEEAVEP
ncbi:shikimate dehydrogenase [Nocardioides sp. Soil796]|uniref:shikimate dehydrogenase n=1 Tax=Nocardioides sp. Soil796 TaxID=1736412 RepID=UPI00070A9F1E|nr:shikimate dehydrogenase [Nocardioides sp. Soil796]KRF16250.1 shikimate dehydrogenase [Nocardioides sp. Soil796]